MSETTYEGHDLEAIAGSPGYHQWIVDQFLPYLRGNTIEYGAGIGSVSALLAPHTTSLALVEPSISLKERLAQRFKDQPSVTVHARSLEEDVAVRARESADCVVLVNVLEHVLDDAAAVRSLGQLLRPSGHLLLFVPAMQALMSDLDRTFGHHRRYERAALVDLVRASGLEVLEARFVDPLGALGWWLMYTVGGKTTFDPAAVKLYEALILPITRALERASFRFGKNLVLVARRRAGRTV